MKRGITIAICCLLLVMTIGIVSAGWYDKVFTQDKTTSKYGKIEVKEVVGGVPTDTYAIYELLSNTDQCLIDCYAEGIVDLKKDGYIFSDLIFKDTSGNQVDIADSKTFIQVTESYEEDVFDKYKIVCDNQNSSGTVCWNEPVLKKEIKTRKLWKVYNNEVLTKGNYRWRIEGKKNYILQRIDWIPKIDNLELSEWAWWNSNWLNSKEVTIVGGEAPLSNFTVYLNISYVTSKMNISFTDLRFVNGTCSGTQTDELDFEFDRIINSSSAGVWVKIPRLNTGNNAICMYYNNPTANSGEDPQNAWDSNYSMILHFSEGSGLKTKDTVTQTLNNLHTPNLDWTTNFSLGYSVRFGGAVRLELNASNLNIDTLQTPLTFEMWLSPKTAGTDIAVFCGTNNGFCYYINSANKLRFGKSGVSSITPTSTLGTGQIYAQFVHNSSHGSFYQNITNDAGNPQSYPITFTNGLDYFLGGETSGSYYSGDMDEVKVSNVARSSAWLNRSYQNSNLTMFTLGTENDAIDILITLNQPAANYVSSLAAVTFNCSANASAGVTNITLLIDGLSNHSVYNTTAKQNYSLQISKNLLEGIHTWNCNVSDGTNWKTGTQRTLTIDLTNPTINITLPLTSYSTLTSGENISLNFSVFDTNRQACWFEYNGANTTLNCAANSSFLYVTGKNNINLWANDSSGRVSNLTRSWTVTFVVGLPQYNNNTYETATESISINITGVSDAKLVYNNVEYTTTISGDIINATFDVPTGSANRSFYFKINSGIYNTTALNQSVRGIIFSLCNTTNNHTYLNFTFKNETLAKETVSATLSGTFYYYLGTGTSNKSYSYTNTAENLSYGFCFTPQDRTYKIFGDTLIYSNIYSQQRSYSFGPSSFVNTSQTNTTLWLLPTSAGQYVTIQVVNGADQPLQGVFVNFSRSGYGDITATTDASGGAIFWVNPIVSYTLTATKAGYDTYSTTLMPSQTTYTITLGSTTTTTDSYYTGVTYSVRPLTSSTIRNMTSYRFNFTISSTYWTLDEWGFTIGNETDVYSTQSSTTGTGGTLNYDMNTGSNKTIVMRYYWIINDTYMNGTAVWSVSSSDGTEFSIWYFLTDFKLYMGQGLFGLSSFGFALIIFIIIFILVGMAAYKFGVVSPAGISGIVFGVVAVFDAGLGLIPTPGGNYVGVATAMTGIIFLALTMREMSQ